MQFYLRKAWLKLMNLTQLLKWVFNFACAGLVIMGFFTLRMPGNSYDGVLPSLTWHQRQLMSELRHHVLVLAGHIGERNVNTHGNLIKAADYIHHSLQSSGYSVKRRAFHLNGKTCYNLEAELPGTAKSEEVIIVCSRYDSPTESPGADGNASGTAAVLALARRFSGQHLSRAIKFVFFVNELTAENSPLETAYAGFSAAISPPGKKTVAVLNLESLGYYSNAEGSQKYPTPIQFFYPKQGNFIAFVGDGFSMNLIQRAVGSFRRNAKFPSEGIVFPYAANSSGELASREGIPQDFPLLTITDMSPFRYPFYHTEKDTPDKLNFSHMARVVTGLEKVVAEIARVTRL